MDHGSMPSRALGRYIILLLYKICVGGSSKIKRHDMRTPKGVLNYIRYSSMNTRQTNRKTVVWIDRLLGSRIEYIRPPS